ESYVLGRVRTSPCARIPYPGDSGVSCVSTTRRVPPQREAYVHNTCAVRGVLRSGACAAGLWTRPLSSGNPAGARRASAEPARRRQVVRRRISTALVYEFRVHAFIGL